MFPILKIDKIDFLGTEVLRIQGSLPVERREEDFVRDEEYSFNVYTHPSNILRIFAC